MSTEPVNRRGFLQDSAAGAVGLTVAPGLLWRPSGAEAPGDSPFTGRWGATPDRVWPGPEYWTNPLQDWRVAGGRLECVKAAPDRNVHLLTRALSEGPGEFRTSVRSGGSAARRSIGAGAPSASASASGARSPITGTASCSGRV
jgi:hypothetical protein